MERIVEKVDASHNRITFIMQSVSERDAWMRTFPVPMPGTHVMAHRWDGMKLHVEPVLKQADKPKVEPLTSLTASPPVAEVLSLDDALAAKLNAMSAADLETYAVERGVIFDAKKHKSRLQKVAAVLEAGVKA